MQAAIEPGIPLAHYRQHRGGVTLICLDCNRHRVFDLEAVIRRLSARGVDGELGPPNQSQERFFDLKRGFSIHR
jgi:hypothetical protein